MAKNKRNRNRNSPSHLTAVQRQRFGVDIEALGITPQDRDVEIRFAVDQEDADLKRRIEILTRYGLVRVRKHADGDTLWRVALTDEGHEIAVEHTLRVTRQKSTKEEKEQFQEARRMQKRMQQGSNPQHGHGGLVDIPLPPDPILITTQTLRSFQHTAREKGLSRLLTDEMLDSLDPNARHRVRQAWKHFSTENYQNARLAMDLFTYMAVDAEPQKHQVILDITLRDWDMLMVPHLNRARADQGIRNQNTLYLAAPQWEAVRSYPVVHELHSFYQGQVQAYNASGWLGPFSVPNRIGDWMMGEREEVVLRGEGALEFLQHPRTIMNAETLDALHDAHPVVIDPEWVEVQEEWHRAEAWAYGERVVLPFEPLYLDLMGAGGRLPEVVIKFDDGDVRVSMSGCLFWKDGDRLVVNPIGGRQILDPVFDTGVLAGANPFEQVGRVILGGRCTYGQAVTVRPTGNEEESMEVRGMYAIPVNRDALQTTGTAIDLMPYSEAPEDVSLYVDDVQRVPGYVEMPITPDESMRPNSRLDGDQIYPWFRGWYLITTSLAAKALSLLSLLDNEHVEIREAEVSRQVRRQIERDREKGREKRIASEIVVVRKYRYEGRRKLDDDEGRHIEYSHQFRVKRHEQHHGPHTPAYRAHPEKAKPCGRCGSCRRFIVDSYIKGPAYKPLRDKKTYVFRDQED